MPPAPSGARISQSPNCVPAGIGIWSGNYMRWPGTACSSTYTRAAVCCSLSRMKKPRLLVFVALALAWNRLAAQRPPDTALLVEINRINAVDNHTHVPKVVGPGEKDDDYDALPCIGYLEPSDDPVMARPDNPLFLEA